MEQFYQFLDNALPDKQGDNSLYKFKKQTIDSMFQRANELASRGLKDEAVINDIVIDEYSDIVEKYNKLENDKKQKRKRIRFLIGNIIGSISYILTLVFLYLGVSFSTRDWAHTWVLLVDGILILVSYILTLIINRILDLKRIFHFIARILLAMDVMVIAVAVFLFGLAIAHVANAWVIIFGGLFAMFLSDAIFASVTKQRLAVINWLIYVPAMSAMLYVIFSAVGLVSWSMGWIMIPASVVIDIIIAVCLIAKNKKTDEEVVDEWKES